MEEYRELIGFIKGYWAKANDEVETNEQCDEITIGERLALANVLRFAGEWEEATEDEETEDESETD